MILFSNPEWLAVIAAIVGVPVGMGIARWAIRMTPLPASAVSDRFTILLTPCAVSAMFGLVVYSLLGWESQRVDEVRPDELWRLGRAGFHLLLTTFLLTATVTDLRDYVIPDEITIPGTLLAIALAVASGDLQTIHLWVDWHDAIPGVQGPYLPDWIRQHPHWHGLAWSLAGLAAGAGMTWAVRASSLWVLGREALGFGDVTLMAMAGSYLGWQPMVIAFGLAPLFGLLFAAANRMTTGRSYIPYGPSLVAGTVVVMLFWRQIWTLELRWGDAGRFSMRLFFGDPVSLAFVAVISTFALWTLLGMVRLARPPIPEDGRESRGTITP